VIGRLDRQASLFSFAFFKEAAAIKDPVLEQIDALLEDDYLLALSRQALAARCAHSAEVGREGIAPDRLLRCVALKHIKGWSFRQLRWELRTNLLYRRFTRFYEDPIPDFTNLSRAFALFGREGTEEIHQRIVQLAKAAGFALGARLRTDTTAVESNIHHPTDSSLLADSLRVLTRSLKRIAKGCQGAPFEVVDHARAAKRRVLEICRAAKSLTQNGADQLEESYRKLIGLTRQVARQARAVVSELSKGQRVARPEAFLQVLKEEACLKHYLPLVEKVSAQSQARIFEGETRHPEKILSLFEPHSVVIRKGKRRINPMSLDDWSVSMKWRTGWSATTRWRQATLAISYNGRRRSRPIVLFSIGLRGWPPPTGASGTLPTKRLPSNWESSRWFCPAGDP